MAMQLHQVVVLANRLTERMLINAVAMQHEINVVHDFITRLY